MTKASKRKEDDGLVYSLARAYAKRYGVENLVGIKPAKLTPAKIKKAKKQYEIMKTRVWARRVRKKYEAKQVRRRVEAGKKTAPAPKAAKPSPMPQTPTEAPAAAPEMNARDALEIAQKLLDYLESIKSLWDSSGLGKLPIEREAGGLIEEIAFAIDNEEVDAIAENADEIQHLFEQGTSYAHKERKGRGYYVDFLNRAKSLLHGSSYEEIGGLES